MRRWKRRNRRPSWHGVRHIVTQTTGTHDERHRDRNFPGTQNRPERDAAEPALIMIDRRHTDRGSEPFGTVTDIIESQPSSPWLRPDNRRIILESRRIPEDPFTRSTGNDLPYVFARCPNVR
jgi:hypothetical protein